MNFNVAFNSKIGAAPRMSALAIALAVASPWHSSLAAHGLHSPCSGTITAAADADAGPEIFHHWPHLAPTMATTDDDTSPDIFHHWPHLASAAGNDQDPTPDIFHHWPHIA